jgi:hypothetical protein
MCSLMSYNVGERYGVTGENGIKRSCLLLIAPVRMISREIE